MSKPILVMFSLIVISQAVPVPQNGPPFGGFFPQFGFPFGGIPQFMNPNPGNNGAVVSNGNGVVFTTVGGSPGSNHNFASGGNGVVFSTVGGSGGTGPNTNYHTFIVTSQQNGDKTHTHVLVDNNGEKEFKEFHS